MAEPRGSTTEVEGGSGWHLVVSGALAYVACAAESTPWHPYAPASVGDTWTFSLVQESAAGTLPTTETIDQIVAVARDGERLVARLRSDFVGASSERDLVISPLGVSPEVGAMTTPIGTMTTQTSEGVYLPRTLTSGMRWTWRQELDAPTSTSSVVGRCAVIGRETIAGMAAVHVRCEMQSLMVARDNPAGLARAEYVQIEDNFYVWGIGLVRSVTTTPSGYRAEKLLLRYQVAGAPQVVLPAP